MLSRLYIATTIYNSFIQSLSVYLEIKARPSNCKKRMNDVLKDIFETREVLRYLLYLYSISIKTEKTSLSKKL